MHYSHKNIHPISQIHRANGLQLLRISEKQKDQKTKIK